MPLLSGISVNAIKPGVGRRPLEATHRTPNNTVTLEARAKSQLPNTVSSSDSLFCFQISKFIPNAAARCVAKTVQCHPRRFHVLVTQFQVPLKLIQNGLARSMHTEMLKRQLVVRDVRVAKNSSCSENGSTRGPSVVMFVFRASPPISISIKMAPETGGILIGR
ncbi:hypothetical protein G2W53_031302 [Senna tora]|uniref:Uncharacterized protein n=1 Tax=Senna tora TaxID=362788 RepID=A0A834T8M2_9FABA|nr:hypothetical protein G2W53_031302 [Senna tora]